MGFDKALITHDGKTLLENLVEVVRSLADEVLISANKPGACSLPDLPVVEDIYRGQGPLAGLHAAMMHSEKRRFLLLACDMPNVNGRLVRAILEASGDCDAVVPRTSDGRNHPLCGVYRRTCLQILERSLAGGRNRVSDFLCLPALRVHPFDARAAGYPDSDFPNLNEKSDLSSLSVPR
jgi:molybdopterin-guanine dinucleotide biosynthesis protein A